MYSTKSSCENLEKYISPRTVHGKKGMSPERSPLVSLSDIHGTAVIVKG